MKMSQLGGPTARQLCGQNTPFHAYHRFFRDHAIRFSRARLTNGRNGGGNLSDGVRKRFIEMQAADLGEDAY
jgi:hypothetical protein